MGAGGYREAISRYWKKKVVEAEVNAHPSDGANPSTLD